MNESNRFEPTIAINNYPTTATATATATKTMPKIKGSFFFVVSALLASDSSSASTSTSSLRGLKTVDDVDTHKMVLRKHWDNATNMDTRLQAILYVKLLIKASFR